LQKTKQTVFIKCLFLRDHSPLTLDIWFVVTASAVKTAKVVTTNLFLNEPLVLSEVKMNSKYGRHKHQINKRQQARIYEANIDRAVNATQSRFRYSVLLAVLLTSFLLIFTACQSNEVLTALVATDPAIAALIVPIDQMTRGDKIRLDQMSIGDKIRFHDRLTEQGTSANLVMSTEQAQSDHQNIQIEGDCNPSYVWESTEMKKFEDRLLQLQMRGKGYIMYFNPQFFRLQ
jgi:hypothetical protein